MPSVDVSLCVVRIETSHSKDFPKPGRSNDIDGEKKLKNSFRVFRGCRKTRDIKIETLPLARKDMATGEDISMKPVISNGTIEKVTPSLLVNGNLSKEVLHFISGNPFVEKTHGLIHLFKEDVLTTIERATVRSQTLCILAIPCTMNCADLLTFLAPCMENIKHIRIIRDNSPNQYMALITFRTPDSISEFYNSFNGIPFNNIEPEWCCHLVFVSRIETLSEDEGGSVAPASHIELPTCPVCLERMDESVDGILTIMCNHSFHGHCLAKWGDTSCPVCRYVQTPEPTDESHCLECMATESLWICLICGHVGCGRYLQGHAYQHYIDTHHCYSMQLGSNSVWDYVGDNFVHRILQNKADGKLVEGPSPDKPVEIEAKLEAMQLEYTYLMTSQLESQRTYYENMISDIEKQACEEILNWKEKVENVTKRNDILSENLNSTIKDKSGLEKKLQAISLRLTTAYKQLQDEKGLNEAMRKNQTVWQDKYNELEEDLKKLKNEKDDELKDLKEQLRDLMFYLEAQNAVSNSPHKDEIQEGKIEIGKAASTSKSHRRRKHH